jgi:hypothetical protein
MEAKLTDTFGQRAIIALRDAALILGCRKIPWQQLLAALYVQLTSPN